LSLTPAHFRQHRDDVNAPEKATGAMTRALQGLKTLIINGDLNPGE
jgi:hypothetical protein